MEEKLPELKMLRKWAELLLSKIAHICFVCLCLIEVSQVFVYYFHISQLQIAQRVMDRQAEASYFNVSVVSDSTKPRWRVQIESGRDEDLSSAEMKIRR